MQQTLPAVPKWITLLEAAQRLGVTERTIRRAITRGELRSQRIPLDKRIFVDAEQVADWEERRRAVLEPEEEERG